MEQYSSVKGDAMSTKLYDISNWCKRGTELEDYPFIGAIDIDVTLGSLVQIDNNYYALGVLNRINNSAGARLIKLNLEPEDEYYNSNLTCPYCGYEDVNSWELQDEDDEHECGRCGAIISFNRVVTVEYNSYPKNPPDIVKAKWVNS